LPVGSLSDDVSGKTLQFAGWLELIAALEAARAAQRPVSEDGGDR
jgi:hypothetical protein